MSAESRGKKFLIHSSRRRFHGDYVEPCILMPHSRFPKIDALYMVFPVSKETFLGWNIMGFKYKLL